MPRGSLLNKPNIIDQRTQQTNQQMKNATK